MKRILCTLILITLVVQPSLVLGQQAGEQKKSGTTPRVETVTIEELLPADTIAFIATTNLTGLLENFRRLNAFKVMEARLPKTEREGSGAALVEAVRFLSFGIKDGSVLDETRLGFAFFKPGDQPDASDQDRERKTQAKAQAAAKAAELRVYAEPKPGGVVLGDPVGVGDGTVQNGGAGLNLVEPHFVAFVEASNLELARKAREQFITYYSQTFSDLGKPGEAKQTRYKGATVERFKNGYVGTMIGATYVLGDQGAIDSILTLRSSSDAPRLSDDLDFARARSKLSPPLGLFAYLNGRPLAELLSKFLGKDANFLVSGAMFGSPNDLFGLDGIKSAALSSTFEREGVIDRLLITLDPAKKNLLATLFAGPAVEFRAKQYVPAGTPILISQSFNLPRIYDDLFVPLFFGSLARYEAVKDLERETQAKGQPPPPARRPDSPGDADIQIHFDPSVAQEVQTALSARVARIEKEIVARYEKEIGFKFREELEKDLGHEVSLALEVPKMNPVKSGENSGYAAFFALRDREATRAALSKLIVYLIGKMGSSVASADSESPSVDGQPQHVTKEKSEAEIKQEQEQRAAQVSALVASMPREVYKKIEITPLFFLAVGFFDDYLVIADSSETIKQLIDTPESGTPITLDPNFRSATSGSPSSAASQIYLAPKYFEDLLDEFQQAWVGKAHDPATAPSISAPATLAAFVESDERSIRLEAFSPIGIPGMIAASMLGDRVRSQTNTHESQASYTLRRLVEAEKVYAAKNQGRYANLDELAKVKLTDFDFSKLKGEPQAYRYELKLKAKAAGFEATATPVRYGRHGRTSFFADESGKIRRADKNGQPATAEDEMMQETGPKEK